MSPANDTEKDSLTERGVSNLRDQEQRRKDKKGARSMDCSSYSTDRVK
jgi:hypothetical protein